MLDTNTTDGFNLMNQKLRESTVQKSMVADRTPAEKNSGKK
jgi:hypothetical protein